MISLREFHVLRLNFSGDTRAIYTFLHDRYYVKAAGSSWDAGALCLEAGEFFC